MPHRTEWEVAEQPSGGEGGVLRPYNREESGGQPREDVALGIGSRSALVEVGREPAPVACRGLLPAPIDVEAEVARQET